MNDRLDRLDRLLEQLGRVLEAPGDEAAESSAEWTWQKLDRLEAGMGADALRALLRRQGMPRAAVDDALEVLSRRRAARG